jgi:hypothetical protein
VNVQTKRGRTQRLASALITLLFIFGTAGIITVSSAPPAMAESSSIRTPEYWWPHNGCNVVTDTPAGVVSFTYACNHHDGCYWGRWSYYRETCDLWFFNDMKYACSRTGYWQQSACYTFARSYYQAVRWWGEPSWNKQIASERINTPMG